MDTMNFLSNTIYVPNINTKFLETMKNSHRRNDAIWLEHYFNLIKYYQKHGNIDVDRFQNKDIYYWLSRQRHEYGKPNHGSLTHVRIGLLNNLDMILGGDLSKIPEKIQSQYMSKLRCIPFSSLGKQNGMLLGIKADEIEVEREEDKKITKNVIIGIYDKSLTKRGEYRALVGLDLI